MKVQSPIAGHQAGRAGGIIFQTYHGRTYGRSMPILFHYPDTPAQQKTQGLFFNILWQFQSIYRSFSKVIPKSTRGNKNIYNTLSQGVYRAAQTYPKAQAKEPPIWFGQDTQRQVRISTADALLAVEPEAIKTEFSVSIKLWRRRFSPVTSHVLLINRTQQGLLAASTIWTDSRVALSFENSVDWHNSDEIRVYVALSNPEFMTNFYRVSI